MNFIQIIPLFVSFTEISFIIFVLVMVFGADKIPEIAKGIENNKRPICNKYSFKNLSQNFFPLESFVSIAEEQHKLA